MRAAETHNRSLMGTCKSSKTTGTVPERFREGVRDVSLRPSQRLHYLMGRPCKKSTEAALYATVPAALQLYLGIRSLNAAPSPAQKSSSGIPSAFVGRGEHARRHVSEMLPHFHGMFLSDRGDESTGSERTKDPVSVKFGE